MTDRKFLVSPGPHLQGGTSVSKIMYLVLLALLLPSTAGIYFFGFYALSVIAVSITAAIITEYAIKKLRKRPFIMDGSSILTGLLLALVLPPTIPLWMVALGSIFSIAIVKEAFGGLGHNIFNPALGGRAFLAACFALDMTTWVAPMGFGADAITTATPLNNNFAWSGNNLSLYQDLLFGNTGGSIGETSALMLIIGGVFLLAIGIIKWQIPIVYIGTVAILTLIMGDDVLFHLLAGGLMIGAFFMATDYVTSPITSTGKIIFGIGAGILTVAIRQFGGLPEGVCYSILFMNAVTPLIDRYVKVRPYGLVKKVVSES
ncbi:MAG: RnfABCDGE type electron transport complex subunit D [Dehalococcoidales bacterium]|nr:RnfABCDGE type electron transport complex subunit D [Dehalococcoidales bacterium]